MQGVKSLMAVGLGGALGTGSRYALSLLALQYEPGLAVLATLAANVLGAALIGYLATRELGTMSSALWMTGFCGGFTTFSLFSLETLMLFERSLGLAFAYAVLSLVLWLIAVWAGYTAGQRKCARSGFPPTRP